MRTLHDKPCDRSGTLSEAHRRMLEVESAIGRDVLEARGVWTVSKPRQLPMVYSNRQRRRVPGWLARVYRPNGKTATVFRPDEVDPDNPGHKYEQPPKRRGGPGNILDVHPFCREWIADLEVPVIFVEGTKKADSLITALRAAGERAVVVCIVGVWNWLADHEPIPDLTDIPLEDRRATVLFDSDVLVKWQVQLAAKQFAEHLRDERGAHVQMTYLEHGAEGAKVGVDDYLASGGSLEGLRRLTRSYDPGDFRLIRLIRNERLRAMLADLERTFWGHPWRGMGGHSARDVLDVAIEEAEHSGVVVEGGLRIELAHRRWRERVRISRRAFYKALDRLEAEGIGYRDRRSQGRKPGEPGGFVLRARVDQDGTETHIEQNATPPLQTLYARGLPLRAPRLRWSSPGRKARRGVVSGTRRVRQAPVPHTAALDPITRPGKIRGALLDALDALGGSASVVAVCEKLERNPKRARDLTRRRRTAKGRDGLAVMLEEAGVLTISEDGGTLTLAENWLEALDELRRAGCEYEADEHEKARHSKERRDYRAGLEAIRRSHEKREREMYREAGSVEDLERVPDLDSEILAALRRAVVRWPDKLDDYPSWWASTLYVEDWLPYKPDPVAVEVALYQLRYAEAA